MLFKEVIPLIVDNVIAVRKALVFGIYLYICYIFSDSATMLYVNITSTLA